MQEVLLAAKDLGFPTLHGAVGSHHRRRRHAERGHIRISPNRRKWLMLF